MVPSDSVGSNRGVAILMMTTTQATRTGRTGTVRQSRRTGMAPAASHLRKAAEVVALLLIALLLIALPILSRDTRGAVSTATTEVIAQPGDTLWSVARSNPLQGLTTAETADHIAALNGIESSRLPVGSSILVPVDSRGRELACK